MKSKKSKKELTSLILTALILGGGCLYGPVAEVDAQELEVTNNMYPANYSSWPDLKKNGLIWDDSNQKLYLKSNTDTLKFNTTDTRWGNYHIFGVYRSSGSATGYTVTLETGPSDYYYALNTLIGGNTDSGKAYSNHVYMNGGKALYVYGGQSQHGEVSVKNVYENTVNITGGEVTQEVYGGRSSKGDANDNSVTIGASTGSIIIGAHVFGGLAGGNTYGYDGSAINNTVTVGNNTTISGTVYGGYSHEGTSSMSTSAEEASSNTVTINGGVLNHIVGGYGVNGNAKNNTVTISNGIINGDIIGAFSALNTYYNKVNITAGSLNGSNKKISGATGAKMSYNSVSIGGGNFNSQSYSIGGVYNDNYTASEITHNSLNLYGTTIGLDNATLAGGYSEHNTGSVSTTDNNIYIGGSRVYANGATSATPQDETPWVGKDSSGNIKNTVITVKNVDKLVLRKVNWSTTVPVLNMTDTIRFNTNGVLDISGMTFANSTSNGTMTLLSGTNPILNLKTLAYSGGSATLSASPITVKAGTSTDKDIGSGVTLTYDEGSHTVKLDDATTTKKVLYTIGDGAVNKVTLGNMTWGTGASGTGYTFGSGTTINAANLTFSDNPYNFGTANPLGSTKASMTLLSNATNIAGTITQPGTDKGILNASFTSNGMTFTGAAKGEVSVNSGTLKYTLKSGALNSVDLSDWTGTAASLTGWTSGLNATTNRVTAGAFTSFDTSTLTADTNIVTSGINNFFKDEYITGASKYNPTDFSDTLTNIGITLAGKEGGGVRASANGQNLYYQPNAKEVASVSLGNMTWGTGASGADYKFVGGASGTSIDAAELNLTTDQALATDAQMVLLSDASGLTAANPVTNGNSKTVSIDNTDANGINFNATATGAVTAAANEVDFAVSGVTLDSIDLAGWNGTNTSTVPTGWTKASPINVAGEFTKPTLEPGASRDILSSEADLFSDAAIDAAIAYATGGSFSDEEAGVTLAGDKAGGVKSTDSGRKLTYYGEKYDVSTVSLGQMTWGTPREATSAYDFAGVTAIDATNLSFTNPLAVGTTASLLTDANNLAAGLPITYASGTYHTQSFTGTAVDNGVKLAGTINGTVSTSAGQVDYTVDSKSITGADLSGWDSTKEAQSLAGWSSSFAAGSISTSGLKAPELTAGASMDILTSSTDNFFNDDYIADDGHKYGSAGPSSSETANGVTFTGNQEKGVKTEDIGKKLVYAVGDMAVTDISLGDMKVGDGGIVNKRTADNHYLFDNNTKIDATSLTFDKPEEVQDSTLVDGAAGITSNNPVTGASHSQALADVDMGAGIKASGTLTGTVSAVDGGVNYAVKNKTVSSMDLSGWDGSTEGSTLPDNKWTGNNVSVNTGAFAAPDADKTVFTTNIDNFFGTVTGDRAYRDNDPFAGDEEKGVALSGTISGGVKASDDGKNLNYYAQSLNTNTITLGEMDWGTGRSMGTGYTFDKVGANGVDASALNFTFNNDEINTIKAGDHWNLLTDASGLKADLTVKGSPVSQKLSYGISKVADLKGTLTGNVTTAVNTVQYNVTTKTLDQVDISSWDGSTTGTQLDSSWTSNDDGIAVTGSGFNAPTTVGEYNILTRNKAGFFAGAQIDDSIKYQPSGTYSESENNISISGKQAKGVLATTDGKSLQYKLGEAYIDTIGLGQLTYAKGAVLMDKSSAMYNYSNVKTLDTSGFALTLTEDQKKTAKDADSMTLLKCNSTLGDIASQDAGTEKYTYTVNPGLTVEADIKTSLSATGGSVLYTVDSNTASDLKFGKLGWNSSTYVRPDSEIAYSTAVVNSENMYFTGVSTLAKNAKMQLVSNFGESINRARAGIFTLDNGKTGKGHAYWDSATKSLMYVVDRGVDEQVAPVEAVKVETTIDGENPHKGDVPGGKAEGDGEAKDNETKVKNSHIQKNDDGTGGNANGGTSENGNANNNKLDVEESEIDGDANGGTSDTGNTEENEVIIKRGTIHGTVTGGETLGGPGGSKGNTTTMEDSTVDGDVNGGKTGGSGNTEENHVILTGSKVGGDVNGGHSGGSGGSKGNETTLDGTEVGGDVNGGKTAGDGETKENKVDIKNGSKIGGNVTGGRSGGNGDSTDNETSVEGQSQVDGDVTGGQSEKGNANKNETTVTEGSKVRGDVTGGKSNGDGTSNENKTTVSGGSEIGGNVVGGHSKNGDTNQNETTVTGGSKVEKDVIGGQNEGKGTSNENKATVDGSTVGGSVTGGQSETGSTDKNEAKVSGKSKVTGDVTGGKTNGDGTSSENKATVSGSEVGGSVVGGQSESGNTDKNEVSVTDGSIVNGSVSGGKTTGSGSANNNTVSIDSSTIKGSLSGGDSTGGSASGNTVTVNNATIGTDGTTDGNIYGGKTLGVNKAADTNTVSLTGGKVNGGVFGGYSENGSAANNSVTVNGTTIRDYIYGGKSKYLSQNDEVYFKNGSVMGIIGGGCEESLNNLAELTDGTVEEHVLGGFATGTDGVAKGNKVQMTGGTVKGSVIGGYGNGTADGNTIYLSGGTVNGADIDSKILNVGEIKGGVYGGYSKDGSTKNNKVNLYGTADVSATGLFGGNQEATGNVLTIGRILDDGTRTAWTGGGQSVKNIKNFESLDFSVVPWSTNQSGIRISDGTNSDLSMTTVSAKQVAFTGVDSLTVNDTMTLLDQSAAANKATAVTADSRYTLGTVGEGTGTLSLDDNNNVIYKVATVKASEQTHNTVMNSSLDMTVLSAGNEFIGSALEGLALPENIGDDGVSVFAKLGGGKMRQDTGSHIDTHTWNAILALGTKNDKKKSSMEYGAFFEYGTGGYATFNGNNRGDGDARYTGGGLLGKWQKKDGLYVEGSFRAGTVHNAARNLLWDALGNPYSYETDSSYWGVHVGVGKEFAVKGKDKLDLYAKYFYNHRGSVSFDAGGHYDLDAVSSKVLRLGTRYTMQRDKWSIYGGVAIDHEFGGKAAGRANGVAIRGADISGTSFRGEIGATVKPDANAPVTVDFNLTGFAGKKRGLSGGVSVAWHF